MNILEKRNQSVKLAVAVFGTFLFALGSNLFIVPMGFYSGGFVGLGQVIRTVLVEYLHVNIGDFDLAGSIYFFINIPLFLIAYRSIGKQFFLKSILCTATMTIFLSMIRSPKQPIIEDALASCLIGGIISGVGTGLTLRAGASAGGGDILGLYFTKKYINFSVGKISILINLFVYGACALMFDLQVVIYSVIYATCVSLAIDRIHAQVINVEVLIFTKADTRLIKKEVFETLGRGMTVWQARGGYTDAPSSVIYTIINKYEMPLMKSIVKGIDPNAFVTFQEGVEVLGNFIKKI